MTNAGSKRKQLGPSAGHGGRGITPVRALLEPSSALLAQVHNGLEAMQARDHSYIEQDLRPDFSDSLELDEAVRKGHDREHRWDYLLGHAPTSAVVAVEPHSAKDDEVGRVIAKRRAALDQLRGHVKADRRIAVWLWVASGRVQFADTERSRRTLDQNGIKFVGKKVLRRHMPSGK